MLEEAIGYSTLVRPRVTKAQYNFIQQGSTNVLSVKYVEKRTHGLWGKTAVIAFSLALIKLVKVTRAVKEMW